jgi:hypothetical protein
MRVTDHENKLARLRAELGARSARGIGLSKSTSNLFRDREAAGQPRIDLSGFNEVVRVDVAGGTVSRA